MGNQTIIEYGQIIRKCRSIFVNKTLDYGTAWRILRLPSITDQIFIKAQRIRSIQEKGEQLVEENISSEFVAIVNYCVIALMQVELSSDATLEIEPDRVFTMFDKYVKNTQELMLKKNHDYGEAWRDMRISSITDLILMKLYRVKQIENHQGKTRISEGIEANYQDMMNYAIFCLIKMEYHKEEN
ncbi:MAG: DUF1599 domain-containing protein [Cytophagales bacterium]|nr:MAG: DUF1599 domain-containing protein [Cytophagales bacterium]